MPERENSPYTKKATGLTRRQAAALVSAGSVGAIAALPSKWRRPVIDAIVVPLHAQATGVPITPFATSIVGPTGVTGGITIDDNNFLGVRFTVAVPGVTTAVSIHAFSLFPSATIFAAVIALTDLSDFPDSLDLSTADLVGSTLLSLTNPSAVVQAPLVLNLAAGTYGLLFGSGLLGASSGFGNTAGATSNNTDIGSPSYFARGSGSYFNGGSNLHMTIS